MTNLPDAWEWTTVAAIAEVQLGRQRSPQHHSGPHMRPYLRAANVTWDGISLSDVKEMNFAPSEATTFGLRRGDILLNEASGSPGEVGKPAIWQDQISGCCFQNTLLRVRTRGPLTEFLYWFFLSAASAGRFGEAGRGVNIRHLGKQGLASFPIPIPPLAEQARIVAALERCAARLDAAGSSLRNGSLRVKSLEEALVAGALEKAGGDLVRWGDVGETLSGRAFPSGAYAPSGIRLLRPGNLHQSGVVVWSDAATKFLPEAYAAENPKYLLTGEHLLMNLTAQSLADDFLGRVCLSTERDRFLLNQRIARLSSAVATPRYLYWMFRSRRFRRYVAGLNTGSLIQHISTKSLAAFEFPLPDRGRQEAAASEIESGLSEARRVGEAVARSERRLPTLRRSILSAAFSGQLVPQDSGDEPASALLDRIRGDRAVRTSGPRIGKVQQR